MDRDELKARTKAFAHRCVKLGLALPQNVLGEHIRRQLIKCSTSVAANHRVACLAQSKADFVSKLSIVIEEADEASFWMEFIMEDKLVKEESVTPLLTEGRELVSIFVSARKTTRTNKEIR